MAKLKRNMIWSGLNGLLGPDHYARVTKDDRTIISLKPDFGNRQFSEAQLNVQSCTKAMLRTPLAPQGPGPVYPGWRCNQNLL